MWKEKLKRQWDENPLQFMLVVGVTAGGVASLMNAVSAAQGRRAYARQINHKIKYGR